MHWQRSVQRRQKPIVQVKDIAAERPAQVGPEPVYDLRARLHCHLLAGREGMCDDARVLGLDPRRHALHSNLPIRAAGETTCRCHAQGCAAPPATPLVHKITTWNLGRRDELLREEARSTPVKKGALQAFDCHLVQTHASMLLCNCSPCRSPSSSCGRHCRGGRQGRARCKTVPRPCAE